MNKAWPIVRLGEVIRQRKDFVRIDDLSTYKRCRVQLYAKGILLRDLVTGSELKTKEQQICRSGDFLVTEIDAKVGGYGIVPDELEGAIVSSHYFLFEVDRTQLDRNFLGYFVKTPDFFDQVSAKGTTNYAAIRPSHVLEYQMPLPSLGEQRRIVAKIDDLAAKIEEAHRLRQQLTEQLEVLSVSTLSEVFDGLLGAAPKNRLLQGSLAEVIAGQHIMANDYNGEGEGFPYITGPADFGPQVPEIKRWTHTPKTTAMPGDVLLTVKGAGVGKINFAPNKEVAIGRQLMAIRPRPAKLFRDFLFYFLKHRFVHFQFIATATTVPGFKKEDVENLDIPIVSLQKQRDFVEYLDGQQKKMDELKRIQTQTAAELDALMPSILDKAFKGEL